MRAFATCPNQIPRALTVQRVRAFQESKIMKFSFHLAASVVPLLVLGSAVALAEMPTAVGEGEGQVNIVAWPGYLERGETDKNYDWVTAFEKETGCKVNVKTAATSDEMVT